jgi:hypothetical protein
MYPAPGQTGASPRDAQMIDLAGLVDLKLRAHRHRDVADVVELLKRIDEAAYIALEAAMVPPLRPELAELRRDALDEMRLG